VPRKTVKERVADSFAEEGSEYIEKYIDMLREEWRSVTTSLSRTILLTLGLVVLFELLLRADTIELTLGPAKLTEPSPILRFIPALIAYLLYEELALMAKWSDISDIYEEILQKYHPKVWANDLELLVAPTQRAFWQIGTFYGESFEARTAQLQRAVSIFSVFGLLLLLTLFQAYAVYRLFQRFGVDDITIWLVTVLAAGFTLAAISIFAIKQSE
jgi:hypothetical protein